MQAYLTIVLTNGSTIQGLQAMADAEKFSEEVLKDVITGASVAMSDELVTSQGKGQA